MNRGGNVWFEMEMSGTALRGRPIARVGNRFAAQAAKQRWAIPCAETVG